MSSNVNNAPFSGAFCYTDSTETNEGLKMDMILLGTAGIMMILAIVAGVALELYFDYTDNKL